VCKARLELRRTYETKTVLRSFDDEFLGRGKSFVLLSGRLTGIGRQCGDVDQPGNLFVDAGLRDYRASPRMTNENSGAILTFKRALVAATSSARDVSGFWTMVT
jgi:hypothetical protein